MHDSGQKSEPILQLNVGKSLGHLLETQQTAVSPAGLRLASLTTDACLAKHTLKSSHIIMHLHILLALSRIDKPIAQVLRTCRRTTGSQSAQREPLFFNKALSVLLGVSARALGQRGRNPLARGHLPPWCTSVQRSGRVPSPTYKCCDTL